MEKIWEQLKTGLKKYYESTHLNGVLLGLSGGMDSALVVVLATEALGRDKVHALMMKTEHTSDLSLAIADKLQKRHGFSYRVLDIDEEVGLEMKKAREEFGAEPTKITRAQLLQQHQAEYRNQTTTSSSLNHTHQRKFSIYFTPFG